MTGFISKFKIPTILGLGIIFLGLSVGIYLTLKEQTFLSQAAPNLTPQDIIFTNITDSQAVISWQTNSPAASFITFGQNNPGEQIVLDDRDNPTPGSTGPKPRLTHYVTLKNLLPKTSYQFKIISGKISSSISKFETAQPLASKAEFTPVIGSVIAGEAPLDDGIVYLSLPEATTQSALIKEGGNFLISLAQIRKNNMTDYQLAEGVVAKLTIHSDKEESSVLFKLKANSEPLPPVKLGQSIDLTAPEETPPPTPTVKDLSKFDLNGDGKINSADNAIILQNFGKNPKEKKADLNKDGKVDQKDLGLMAQELKDLGSQ